MIAGEHFGSRSIRIKTSELCSSWRRLENKMADRGDKLRQAGQQEQLMELLQVNTVTCSALPPHSASTGWDGSNIYYFTFESVKSS